MPAVAPPACRDLRRPVAFVNVTVSQRVPACSPPMTNGVHPFASTVTPTNSEGAYVVVRYEVCGHALAEGVPEPATGGNIAERLAPLAPPPHRANRVTERDDGQYVKVVGDGEQGTHRLQVEEPDPVRPDPRRPG